MNFHPSVLQSARINAAAVSTSDCISKKTGVVTDAIERRHVLVVRTHIRGVHILTHIRALFIVGMLVCSLLF